MLLIVIAYILATFKKIVLIKEVLFVYFSNLRSFLKILKIANGSLLFNYLSNAKYWLNYTFE